MKTLLALVTILFLLGCIDKGENPNPSTGILSDIEGNKYKTVKIGDQIWMAENLRVSKFCDGTQIPNLKLNWGQPMDPDTWKFLDATEPALCNYGDDPNLGLLYGYLYNWYAVNSSQCLCPEGWRVPTEIDWQLLLDFLGENSGAKLKEKGYEHWKPSGDPMSSGTNESGFTALPGEERYYSLQEGSGSIGYNATWWSSSPENCSGSEDLRTSFSVFYDDHIAYISCDYRFSGLSVRCIKN